MRRAEERSVGDDRWLRKLADRTLEAAAVARACSPTLRAPVWDELTSQALGEYAQGAERWRALLA